MITYVYEDELDDYLDLGYTMDQLHVISENERVSPEEEIRKTVKKVVSEIFDFNNNKSFTPPSNVVAKAKEALAAVSNNNLTQKGGNEGSGYQKAKSLAQKEAQNHSMMKRMKSFFDSNEDSVRQERNSGKTINNSGVIQSWELHGGDECKNWVANSISNLKDNNLRTKKNLRDAGGAGKNKGMGIFDTNPMSTNNHRINR